MGKKSASTCVLLLASVIAGAEVPRAIAAETTAPEQKAASNAEAVQGARVLFTGFVRRVDKSATILVRLTSEVPVNVDRSERRVTYRLGGAKLGVPNSGNPLPTEHFGPPVSHVALVAHDGGVDLVIDLTKDASEAPKHRLVSQGALATLLIDLPAAQ